MKGCLSPERTFLVLVIILLCSVDEAIHFLTKSYEMGIHYSKEYAVITIDFNRLAAMEKLNGEQKELFNGILNIRAKLILDHEEEHIPLIKHINETLHQELNSTDIAEEGV